MWSFKKSVLATAIAAVVLIFSVNYYMLIFFILLAGFGVTDNISGYLFIFLLSSIVAVLPLTLGGIGSREVTFYYGATWLALNQNTSISVSMLFFLCTAIISLIGLIYHLKKPVLKTL